MVCFIDFYICSMAANYKSKMYLFKKSHIKCQCKQSGGYSSWRNEFSY